MVKIKVKGKKIKFGPSTKGSGKQDNGDSNAAPSSSTPTSASTTSAMSSARAEYYADRNSTNPFGDDSPAKKGGSGTNPFESKSSGTANPFDDSDSDGGGDDPLAGFSKKPSSGQRSTPPPPPPRGGANPFDSPAPGNRSNNPFGDGDDDDKNRGASGNGRAVQSMRIPAGGSNPFDDAGGARRATVNTASNDPFRAEMKAKSPPQFDRKGLSKSTGRQGQSARPPPPPPHRPTSSGSGQQSSNPFDNDDARGASERTERLPPVPKPLISSAPVQRRTVSGNPFGDDPVPNKSASTAKTRWSTLAPTVNRGGMGDGDSTRPILQAMDEETVATQLSSGTLGATGSAAGLASWLRLNKKEDERAEGGGGAANGRLHNSMPARSGSYNTAAARAAAKAGPAASTPPRPSVASSAKPRRKTKKKCKVVTPWPFDNYHVVQEQMYEELASRAASEYSALNQFDEKKDDHRRGPPGPKPLTRARTGGGAAAAADSSKYYERPEELPSIKEAVNDLALVEFEKKAEERANNIVSTWLFDAGLIDELLVNGAVGPQQQQQSQPNMSSTGTVASTKTSEGQEIGVNGFLVGAEGAGLKMDKETNKLRAMIQRDLSIINARLNDGVAASGLEVQELVNAVSATKEDIGRLRELTTYISDGQRQSMSDRDEFLLAQYPYLRKAINARRNIHRCFSELEFFGHIPSTCERLRDDLHGGEWTDEEWSTIRKVSMEHVKLEVMLVEAENSMKGGSSSHNFNDAVVDSFLEAHVQNVWELGDEIRMRIISGVGSAFDLSINNPAGMVALLEAVEVYERAAETFKKKKEEQGNSTESTRLNFTNMRSAALEQLYQDFEMRGMEMFRGVHENVRVMQFAELSLHIFGRFVSYETVIYRDIHSLLRLRIWQRKKTPQTLNSPLSSKRQRSW